MISIREWDRWQIKQDHFNKDSRHKPIKLIASTHFKIRTIMQHFWSTINSYIYFVRIFPSFCFSFCWCAALIYIAYCAPSRMATPDKWGELGRFKWHCLHPRTSSVLFCLVRVSLLTASVGSLLRQKKNHSLNCFLTCALVNSFLLSFFNAHFHPPHANIAI